MIEQFTWECINSNSFYIEEKNRGLLIDPVDSDELYAKVSKLSDVLIFLTHCHYDHICGLNTVRTLTNSKVVCTETCSVNITSPKKNLSSIANSLIQLYDEPTDRKVLVTPFSCAPADIICHDGDNFFWCGHTLDIIELNGHTKGCIAILLDSRFLFSGDSVLPYVTITRLPGGSTARFWQEDVPKLEALTVDMVYPGHGQPGILRDMLALNKKPDRFYSE